MEKIVGVTQLYFMPHPLLEIVQRLMAHPVVPNQNLKLDQVSIFPTIFEFFIGLLK